MPSTTFIWNSEWFPSLCVSVQHSVHLNRMSVLFLKAFHWLIGSNPSSLAKNTKGLVSWPFVDTLASIFTSLCLTVYVPATLKLGIALSSQVVSHLAYCSHYYLCLIARIAQYPILPSSY